MWKPGGGTRAQNSGGAGEGGGPGQGAALLGLLGVLGLGRRRSAR